MPFANNLLAGHRKSNPESDSDIALVPQVDRDNTDKKSFGISSFNTTPPPENEYAPSYSYNSARNSGTQYQNIPKWPRNPVTLGYTASDVIQHSFHDLFMVCVPIPFFVLAGIVIKRHGHTVDDDDWDRIVTATKVVCIPLVDIASADIAGRHDISHRICSYCRTSH